jgi:hypothetical protein
MEEVLPMMMVMDKAALVGMVVTPLAVEVYLVQHMVEEAQDI